MKVIGHPSEVTTVTTEEPLGDKNTSIVSVKVRRSQVNIGEQTSSFHSKVMSACDSESLASNIVSREMTSSQPNTMDGEIDGVGEQLKRRRLLERIRRNFGVWGEPLQPETEYKERIVWYEDGGPHSFWINFDTETQRRFQKAIQNSLHKAPPLPQDSIWYS